MKSSKKWSYRRQSVVVKKGSPLYQEIDNLCFKSKNLFNATLYSERQSYFNTGKFKYYNQVNKDFTDKNQPDYRALPAKVSKHTQMKVDQAIKSFLDGDFIPTFNESGEKEKHTFSGRRISRGLYETKNKKIINADVNGSLNILRKFINKNVTGKFQNNIWEDLAEVCSTPYKVTVSIN